MRLAFYCITLLFLVSYLSVGCDPAAVTRQQQILDSFQTLTDSLRVQEDRTMEDMAEPGPLYERIMRQKDAFPSQAQHAQRVADIWHKAVAYMDSMKAEIMAHADAAGEQGMSLGTAQEQRIATLFLDMYTTTSAALTDKGNQSLLDKAMLLRGNKYYNTPGWLARSVDGVPASVAVTTLTMLEAHLREMAGIALRDNVRSMRSTK